MRKNIKLLLIICCIVISFYSCNKPKESRASNTTPVRIGYFPNILHSQAIIGATRGDFQQALGKEYKAEFTLFNAGPAAIEAMFAGQIDFCYIGPNPAINAWVKSSGEAIQIVSGAASGGASFILRQDVILSSVDDYANKTFASPQLGNTQDVALRAFLAEKGLKSAEFGGTLRVQPMENPQILDLFRLSKLDGAWVPEPWASRLVVEAAGKEFVDERTLWPNGDFVTAHIIASRDFIKNHPDAVRAIVAANVDITVWANENPKQALELVSTGIKTITGKTLPEAVMQRAWTKMRITWDPISSSLIASASNAYKAGFLKAMPSLDGIYELKFLNEALKERKFAEIH